VLVVTSDLGQEQRIQRLCWTCAEAGLLIRTTTASRLEQQGPLAPIWLTMLPNQPYPLQQSFHESDTPALKGGACGQTPPQFGVPLQACRFGFAVRHIRGT
jgi:hypothetical protein